MTVSRPPRKSTAENLFFRGWHSGLFLVLFFILLYFPIFLNLDVLPLRAWDESRYAVNAYEMYRGGDWLVVKYDGHPDLWAVKPPLLIWTQAILFHVMGPGDLAVRLPSAISAFLLGLVLLWHSWRCLGRPWLALFAVLILFTSDGILHMHGTRGGTQDMPLAFFMCASLLVLHHWTIQGNKGQVLGAFLLLTLEVLTKSIQALFFLPGIAIFLIIQRKTPQFLRERATWIGSGILIILVLAYYLAREHASPGYLAAVWHNELWGRYTSPLEGHDHPWDHNISLLIQRDLHEWHLLVPVGVVLGLIHSDPRVRSLTTIITLSVCSYLLIIIGSSTKLPWYNVPVLPLLALLASIPLYSIMTWVMRWRPLTMDLRTIAPIPYLFVFLLFSSSWGAVVERNYLAQETLEEVDGYFLSQHLKDVLLDRRPLGADVIVRTDVDQHLNLYIHMLNDRGHSLHLREVDQLEPGQRVLTDEWPVHGTIMGSYEYEVLMSDRHLRIFGILGRRTVMDVTSFGSS